MLMKIQVLGYDNMSILSSYWCIEEACCFHLKGLSSQSPGLLMMRNRILLVAQLCWYVSLSDKMSASLQLRVIRSHPHTTE